MKNYRRQIAVILSLILLLILTLFASSAYASSISPALNVISQSISLDICSEVGKPVRFSESLIGSAVGSSLISEIEIGSLPDEALGSLMLGEREVKVGEKIKSGELKKLVFLPKNTSPCETAFCFVISSFGHSYPISCNIKLTDKLNFSPNIAEKMQTLETFSNVCRYSTLNARDPEGDKLKFEIVSYPLHGSLRLLDSESGDYVYEPYPDECGKDSFVYRVKDSMGNVSPDSKVNINISELSNDLLYCDTDQTRAEYPAAKLLVLNVYSGEKFGNARFFKPSSLISKQEFVMMTMTATGIDFSEESICSNENECCGISDINGLPAEAASCISLAYNKGFIDPGLTNEQSELHPNEPISVADAISIARKIAKYLGKKIDPELSQSSDSMLTNESAALIALSLTDD